MDDYLTKNVVLEPIDYNIIDIEREKRGLGRKGFSAALRLIVREWKELTTSPPGNGNTPDSGEPK